MSTSYSESYSFETRTFDFQSKLISILKKNFKFEGSYYLVLRNYIASNQWQSWFLQEGRQRWQSHLLSSFEFVSAADISKQPWKQGIGKCSDKTMSGPFFDTLANIKRRDTKGKRYFFSQKIYFGYCIHNYFWYLFPFNIEKNRPILPVLLLCFHLFCFIVVTTTFFITVL